MTSSPSWQPSPMPEMRKFVVTEIREVAVRANTTADAVRIADAAFTNGQDIENGVIDGPPVIWGNTTTRVRQTALAAEEVS